MTKDREFYLFFYTLDVTYNSDHSEESSIHTIWSRVPVVFLGSPS